MTTTKPITLDEPIKRGDTAITELTLRKPGAGELRGVTLTDLLQMDVGALIKVLPRVTVPAITEQEASKLDPADLTQLGTEVATFLLTKSAKAEIHSPTP